MIFGRSLTRADSPFRKLRGARFLLGALPATLLVLSATGASLALFAVPMSGGQGHYRLPRPALSLMAVSATKSAGTYPSLPLAGTGSCKTAS